MPFIKSLAFKRLTYCFKLVAVILLLSKNTYLFALYRERVSIYYNYSFI